MSTSSSPFSGSRSNSKNGLSRGKSSLTSLGDNSTENLMLLMEALEEPSVLWGGLSAPVSPRTRRKRAKEVKEKALIAGRFSFEDVLSDRLKYPLDLASFARFCASTYTQEHLAFVLLIRKFIAVKPSGLFYNRFLRCIQKKYLDIVSESCINIKDIERKKVVEIAEACISNKNYDHNIFNSLLSDITMLLNIDSFIRFRRQVSQHKSLMQERSMALWCCTSDIKRCSDFFKLPNPTSMIHHRLCNLINGLIISWGILNLAVFNGSMLIPGSAAIIGMLLRLICGPRLDPISFLVIFVLEPLVGYLRIMTPKFVINHVKRLSESIGILCMGTALVCELSGMVIWGLSLASFHVFFIFFELAFNFCILEIIFRKLGSYGLVPKLEVTTLVTKSQGVLSVQVHEPCSSRKSPLKKQRSSALSFSPVVSPATMATPQIVQMPINSGGDMKTFGNKDIPKFSLTASAPQPTGQGQTDTSLENVIRIGRTSPVSKNILSSKSRMITNSNKEIYIGNIRSRIIIDGKHRGRETKVLLYREQSA